MPSLPGGWKTAAGSAAVFLLLLVPVRLPAGGRWVEAWSAGAHVVLFAALAWLWGRGLPGWSRGWRLWGVLAAVAAAVEGLQLWTGRSVGWADWCSGAAGAACVCATWRVRGGIRLLAVLALAFLPAAWEAAQQILEKRDFPILADPARRWAGRGWIENGGRLQREEEGFRFLSDDPTTPAAYPGVFRVPAAKDWRKIEALDTSLYWPEEKPAVMGLRVDDQPGRLVQDQQVLVLEAKAQVHGAFGEQHAQHPPGADQGHRHLAVGLREAGVGNVHAPQRWRIGRGMGIHAVADGMAVGDRKSVV